MADAFLQIALEKLSELIQGEIGLITGVDEEKKKLDSTLTAVRAVLEDAEYQQLKSSAIRDWLTKLNDLAYEIDDILDECATEVSKLKHRNSKFSRYRLKNILFRRKIGRKMKQVTKELDRVAAERTKFHLREMDVVKPSEYVPSRETTSVLNESRHIYGREDDQEKIVDILVNHAKDNDEISILPIIGVGGLGKTTLAQLVFKDQRVGEHFGKKIWVSVSDNFDIKILVKAMIESATGDGNASNLERLDTLERRLLELLNQKRYLIVLDDVWSDDQEKWFQLRNVLACGAAGSSIIVTTRSKKVAEIMGTLPAHYLTGLSEEHCWMLLRKHAFGEDKEEYPNLESIGKQIAKKCAGVPLAAKALGGILLFKREEKEWINVKESEMWNLPEDETLMPALRLSYHHLPLALRQCFAYYAVIRIHKGDGFNKEGLIQRWMAHGYISSNGISEVEDVGNAICNELVLRSLLEFSDEEKTALTMHDLVRDLARSIIQDKIPGTQVQGNVRSASSSKIREVCMRDKSVPFPTSHQPDMDLSFILANFCCLRILDANLAMITHLPSAIGRLKHLRTLYLALTPIRTLPESLCSLWNLQLLNLNDCSELVALPKNMRYLINLRHLFLEECTSLSVMPPKIGELKRLRTLSLFIVDRNNQLEELQFLNLGGKLTIRNLERVKNCIDAKRAILAEKKNLRHLSLEWGDGNGSETGEDVDEKVLEALEPHPNLEILEIKRFRGKRFPVWMSNSTLEKVVEIEIWGCQNCLHLPRLGALPHLKSLALFFLPVEYVIDDEGGNTVETQFPALEILALGSLPNLKALFKKKMTAFPNLKELGLLHCSSIILPSLTPFQKLERLRCNSSTLASYSKLENVIDLLVMIDENMRCIPTETFQNLTNLKKLAIWNPNEHCLPEDGLQALRYLTRLVIGEGEALTCLPEGWLRHLTTLEVLEISGCPQLVELPEVIKDLHSLKHVELSDFYKMESLPEALRHLSSLQSLKLNRHPELKSLPDWLDNLTSLQSLEVFLCPDIASLPGCIRGMSNLECLKVLMCPQLETRCEREKGEDWHKISHIPNLEIGF